MNVFEEIVFHFLESVTDVYSQGAEAVTSALADALAEVAPVHPLRVRAFYVSYRLLSLVNGKCFLFLRIFYIYSFAVSQVKFLVIFFCVGIVFVY